MSELKISGDVRSFFTHFSAYGLAAILEAELGVTARVHAESLQSMTVRIDRAETEQAMAGAVKQHAVKHLDSWVMRTHEHMKRESGTMSPRLKAPDSRATWEILQAARQATLDSVIPGYGTATDLRFMGALGEPAYWYVDKGGKEQPDRGASGWEMKTRNRGEEFVRNRLALLCRAVAERDETSVLEGITGVRPQDEAGRNAVDSRTPTGLTRPGPTDNALAWCALWGISFFPVSHSTRKMPGMRDGSGRQSVTAGVLRGLPRLHVQARAVTYLPLFSHPLTLPRIRSIIVSAALARVAAGEALRRTRSQWTRQEAERWNAASTGLSRPAHVNWLTTKGLDALLLSHLAASDNVNAPELHMAMGEIIPLEGLGP